jgi:hypothetical protein
MKKPNRHQPMTLFPTAAEFEHALDYDQRRKTKEAQEADQQDEADLKALEQKLKRRPQ